ncbi:RING-H2 finger protein ATL52-like [Gastrolobium bilobum]|uniref:RING-H2 finger protein ATL52-like n=1 Tax=Gastrolobium bilobum TaxID=150636 RepID=UPI002AAF5DDE|nr:RING-H2 finger protein ATL52-like [Gastrolobium bilobum]
MDGDDDGHPFRENVVVLLIAMGSAAFVVSTYHLIAIWCCNQRLTDDQNSTEQQPPPTPTINASISSSLALMIPTHKYHKKKKKKGDHVVSDDGDRDEGDTCAVCLGDFEDGEELRTLPECMHSFHVPCIDMWLHSHSSCPICRASATPSPAALHHLPDFGPPDLNAHHSIDVMEIGLVQSGLPPR